MELEEQIDELQEHLPEGYTVCIKIQNGAVWCVVSIPMKKRLTYMKMKRA